MPSGLIFNLQRYSVHDGPGIRTTVFFKGCPLRCAWCHNAEGICGQREILILENRCLLCQECRRACPFGSQEPGAGAMNPTDPRCTFCGKCVDACPSQARRMAGREVTLPDMMAQLLRDRVFYDESGGGVTFSGGEPLAQPGFLLNVLRACKEQGLHTAVDTCGLAPTRQLLGIVPFTDLFLFDLKLMDDGRHRELTGSSNIPILENLRALSQVNAHIWVRVPVIPGVNDHPRDLQATANFVTQLPSVTQVNLLPYHRNGIAKADRLGRQSQLTGTLPPSTEAMDQARNVFEQAGLRTCIGG